MLVSVIGGDKAPPEILKEAEELGRGLAKCGLTVICGGLGGVMEAVCRRPDRRYSAGNPGRGG